MPKTKPFVSENEDTEFKDKAISDSEYDGDGKEQADFFSNHTNMDELINNMSQSARDDISNFWTQGAFMEGDGHSQYAGWDNMSVVYKRMTQNFDDLLDKTTTDKGFVVTRLSDAQLLLGGGNKNITLEQLQNMKGSVITSLGNMSAAAASQGLAIDDPTKNVEYRITIPKGSKGAGMYVGDNRVNARWGNRQREFMINRDSQFKVGKASYDANRKVYVVNLTYDGHLEHNYGSSGRLPDYSKVSTTLPQNRVRKSRT